MSRKQKKAKKKRSSVAFWTAFAVVCAVLGGVLGWVQMDKYEQGVVEIYATQQDAYVQLVLDQINLNKTRRDESVIVEIIGTLDNSTNKYWTLSHGETLLFVRDVAETNRYKGFSTETYYISDSAKAFIDGLNVNRVEHELIDIDGREYIASGVLFEYRGINYQVCLLTNPDAVLDHNAYLGAKINIFVLLGTILGIFIVTIIGMAMVCGKRTAQLRKEEETNRALSRMVEQLNNAISMEELYDARLAVFRMDYLPLLAEKLTKRRLYPVTVLKLNYCTEKAAEFFLKDSYLMLNRRILRFRDSKNGCLILLCIRYQEKEAIKAVDWLMGRELTLAAAWTCGPGRELSLRAVVDKIGKMEAQNGK